MALAALVAPFVLAWIIFLVLREQAASSLARTLGAAADPGQIARKAEMLANLQLSHWANPVTGLMLFLWVGTLMSLTWTAFTAPLSRRDAIRTRRLLLRRARADDLAAFHAIFSDGEALRYWDSFPHGKMEETESWLAALLAQSPTDGDLFVIERQGLVIGLIGIWRWPWLNYLVARPAWRNGYGTEAMTAYLRYIFGRGLNLVTAATDQRNGASQALLRKAGFQEYQRGEGRHLAKDEAYSFIAMRRDRPSWSVTLRHLSRRPQRTTGAGPTAPLWA